jgi:predicted nucleotide-binding protein
LTDGGAQADNITLTALGRRIVAPTKEGDDLAAKREAFLKPTIIGAFLRKYDGSRFPDPRIAANVLEELDLPGDATERAVSVIKKGAESLGFLVQGKGGAYVDLRGTARTAVAEIDEDDGGDDSGIADTTEEPEAEHEPPAETVVPVTLTVNRRVYITHGSNKGIVAQLKELVTYGDLTPVVSEERETPALSISDRVLNDMRSCGGAIVHVGSEEKLRDADGNDRVILNQNVLIEIGAALALYSRRFILLVEKGVKLPTNLSGLYEVRYEGDKLDYEATMKLLKALSRLKEGEAPK